MKYIARYKCSMGNVEIQVRAVSMTFSYTSRTTVKRSMYLWIDPFVSMGFLLFFFFFLNTFFVSLGFGVISI